MNYLVLILCFLCLNLFGFIVCDFRYTFPSGFHNYEQGNHHYSVQVPSQNGFYETLRYNPPSMITTIPLQLYLDPYINITSIHWGPLRDNNPNYISSINPQNVISYANNLYEILIPFLSNSDLLVKIKFQDDVEYRWDIIFEPDLSEFIDFNITNCDLTFNNTFAKSVLYKASLSPYQTDYQILLPQADYSTSTINLIYKFNNYSVSLYPDFRCEVELRESRMPRSKDVEFSSNPRLESGYFIIENIPVYPYPSRYQTDPNSEIYVKITCSQGTKSKEYFVEIVTDPNDDDNAITTLDIQKVLLYETDVLQPPFDPRVTHYEIYVADPSFDDNGKPTLDIAFDLFGDKSKKPIFTPYYIYPVPNEFNKRISYAFSTTQLTLWGIPAEENLILEVGLLSTDPYELGNNKLYFFTIHSAYVDNSYPIVEIAFSAPTVSLNSPFNYTKLLYQITFGEGFSDVSFHMDIWLQTNFRRGVMAGYYRIAHNSLPTSLLVTQDSLNPSFYRIQHIPTNALSDSILEITFNSHESPTTDIYRFHVPKWNSSAHPYKIAPIAANLCILTGLHIQDENEEDYLNFIKDRTIYSARPLSRGITDLKVILLMPPGCRPPILYFEKLNSDSWDTQPISSVVEQTHNQKIVYQFQTELLKISAQQVNDDPSLDRFVTLTIITTSTKVYKIDLDIIYLYDPPKLDTLSLSGDHGDVQCSPEFQSEHNKYTINGLTKDTKLLKFIFDSELFDDIPPLNISFKFQGLSKSTLSALNRIETEEFSPKIVQVDLNTLVTKLDKTPPSVQLDFELIYNSVPNIYSFTIVFAVPISPLATLNSIKIEYKNSITHSDTPSAFIPVSYNYNPTDLFYQVDLDGFTEQLCFLVSHNTSQVLIPYLFDNASLVIDPISILKTQQEDQYINYTIRLNGLVDFYLLHNPTRNTIPDYIKFNIKSTSLLGKKPFISYEYQISLANLNYERPCLINNIAPLIESIYNFDNLIIDNKLDTFKKEVHEYFMNLTVVSKVTLDFNITLFFVSFLVSTNSPVLSVSNQQFHNARNQYHLTSLEYEINNNNNNNNQIRNNWLKQETVDETTQLTTAKIPIKADFNMKSIELQFVIKNSTSSNIYTIHISTSFNSQISTIEKVYYVVKNFISDSMFITIALVCIIIILIVTVIIRKYRENKNSNDYSNVDQYDPEENIVVNTPMKLQSQYVNNQKTNGKRPDFSLNSSKSINMGAAERDEIELIGFDSQTNHLNLQEEDDGELIM